MAWIGNQGSPEIIVRYLPMSDLLDIKFLNDFKASFGEHFFCVVNSWLVERPPKWSSKPNPENSDIVQEGLKIINQTN